MTKDDINLRYRRKISYLASLASRSLNINDFRNMDEDVGKLLAMMLDDTYTSPVSIETQTSIDQEETEESITGIYERIGSRNLMKGAFSFEKELHYDYALSSLNSPLPSYFRSLDANHGWMIYWLCNSLDVVSGSDLGWLTEELQDLVRRKIERNISNEGLDGIGGGKGQLGHVASCYASILSLVIADQYLLLSKLRKNLYSWFLKLKRKDGSFSMHYGGESDTRSVYCVLLSATILGILDEKLSEGVIEWINRCQTYEGGFAGVPGTEAHGGYTFCALASYLLLLKPCDGSLYSQLAKNIDIDLLIRWCVMRQHKAEGAFSGRTNKLVDACYSFWIGASLAMIELALEKSSIFNRDALRLYILNCSQSTHSGGFKDKPGKGVDFYHTNYALCGLSIAEHQFSFTSDKDNLQLSFALLIYTSPVRDTESTSPVNPVFGIKMDRVSKCRERVIDKYVSL